MSNSVKVVFVDDIPPVLRESTWKRVRGDECFEFGLQPALVPRSEKSYRETIDYG